MYFKMVLVMCATIPLLHSQKKDADEARPYEFGFTIDGQQHRHEKKDANGIIQGEFGFITADGVYHVTTYATDENGSFRILSMKNIKISEPLDGSGGSSSKSPAGGNFGSAQNAQKPTSGSKPTSGLVQPAITSLEEQKFGQLQSLQTTTKKPYQITTQSTVKPACASCGYVTYSTPSSLSFFGTTSTETAVNQNVPSFGNANEIQLPHANFAGNNEYKPGVIAPLEQINGNTLGSTQQGQYNANGIEPSTFNDQNRGDVALGGAVFTNQNTPQVGPTQHGFVGQQPGVGVGVHQTVSSFPISQGLTPNVPVGLQSVSNEGSLNSNLGSFPPPGSNLHDQGVAVQYPGAPQATRPPYQFSPTPSVEIFNSDHVTLNVPQPPQSPLSNYQNVPQHHVLAPQNASPKPRPPEVAGQITVSDGYIHVPNNAPIKIKDKYPGMAEGLPDGITEGDIVDLLYKFNYTIGFHGHYEKGLRNGTKIGGYFVNGRDGFSRVVTYVADEFGYRPKFKLINLGLESPDTPKEATEKSFGLKSFEFVWYPLK